MSKRGDKRRKRQKVQRQSKKKSYINQDPEFLQYCSNLDDSEYACLWELYDPPSGWWSELMSTITDLFQTIKTKLITKFH